MKLIKKIIIAVVMLSITVAIPSLVPQHHVFGKMLLPMHFTVLLSAYIVGGPLAMVIGAMAPVMRHYFVGMPALSVAGPMCFELAVYGLVAGLLYTFSSHKGRSVVKSLLAAMLAGRIIWGIATYFEYSDMGVPFTFNMFITEAFVKAVPGVIIQLFAISLIVYYLKKYEKI